LVLENSHELALVAASFSFGMGLFWILRARQEKERLFYVTAALGFLMGLIGVLVFLKQIWFTLAVIYLSCLLVAATWSRMMRLLERGYAKTLQETDLSAPLELRDFLSLRAWMKMMSRWGLWKTLLFTWILGVATGIGPFLIFSLLGWISITDALFTVVFGSTGATITFYWQFADLF
jgi:hypothetical protein